MEKEELIIGKKYLIHAYKHDGKIHRSWDEAVLLEIHDDYLVFGNERTKVTESDGRTWRTKEPAVLYFFYNSWYNIIGQYKKDGIYYYCNIASPFIVEEGAIKYIDYDLDLRKGSYGEQLLPDNYVIMEIKVPKMAPLWLVQLLSKLNVYTTSFSKVGTAYKTMLAKKIGASPISTGNPRLLYNSEIDINDMTEVNITQDYSTEGVV